MPMISKQAKRTIQKVALVIYLSALIWVWADLSNDLILEGKGVTVLISNDRPKDIWVGLEGADSVQISVDLKGPSARIDELKRDVAALEVYFSPSELSEMSDNFKYPIKNLVQESPRIRELGLTVEKCKPSSIDITMERLEKKQLKVVCIDENSNRITNVSIDPANIEMYVPSHWSGENLTATVVINSDQHTAAMTKSVSLRPWVEIEADRKVFAEKSVKVHLIAQEANLETFLLNGPRIGLLMNEQVAKDYRVEIVSRNEALTTIQVQASQEAYQKYKSEKYQMIVSIYPEDVPSGTDLPQDIERQVDYFFPKLFERQGLIKSVDTGVKPIVTFRLVPINK